MLLQGIHNQNRMRTPQVQPSPLQQVVSQINANLSQKQNLDVIELSQRAQALLSAQNADKTQENEPMLHYQTSEMVHSEKWGSYTKAEYAEMSLQSQRNDLQTFSDQIDYQKSKLAFTTEKITELENYLNGTGAHSDPNMTKALAQAHLHNYQQSIVQDYADFTIGRSQYHADAFDQLSGVLAAKVFENPLHTLNAESLGLSNLSDDPQEIMAALDNASNILAQMRADLEHAFSEATGGKAFAEPVKSWSIFDGNSGFDFFVSQMETGYTHITVDQNFTGETLHIGISSAASLPVADTTR